MLERAAECNVKFIRLQFTDILGSLKNIAVTVEELERALEGLVIFDSSVVESIVTSKERDIFLHPDPATFEIFPWRPRDGAVARLICDVRTPGGGTFSGCSRSALKQMAVKLEDHGLELRVGAQIEFFLFHSDNQGNPTTQAHDRAGYCDLTPVDQGENARRDMVLTLEEMGFEVSSSHHEKAPGQHEIFFKEDSVPGIADKIATFKFVVRTVAQRHGLHASFMPKPFSRHNGSGMHLHLSLWNGEGDNLLDCTLGRLGLSESALHFIGGILLSARSLTAISNQLVNSYKRFLLDGIHPVLATWSENNRVTMLRIPPQRGINTRIVWRSPDPSCNPYLTLAAVAAAGLNGVFGCIEPPQVLPDENYHPADLASMFKESGLPRSLGEALNCLAADVIIKEALGSHIVNRFLELKEHEWARFQSEVHQWELDEYLANY